jgi:SOS-response transcriptional repressor LexA
LTPGLEVVSGDYVIAKNGKQATCKQFIVDGSNIYLKTVNNRYPIKDMTGIEMKIVGVVVEKRNAT